jgi:predicted  nucleic acid-binding Zn-ribbon protein
MEVHTFHTSFSPSTFCPFLSTKPLPGAFFLLRMLPDLGRLIHLQQLETTADDARRKISDHPRRIQALDERLQTAREALAGAKTMLTEAQDTRRTEEKEVAIVQARLAKYKDQLLELKTNREYQAMLHEIETAQTDIRWREDRILETMMEADELGAKVKKAEADLKGVEKEVGAERQALEKEVAALQVELNRTAAARAQLASQIDPGVLAIFEVTAKSRKGVAVAEARNGLCNICHVRLRPQMFNEVRKNESIIQCDSCRRILYFAGDGARVVAAESTQPNAPAEE